MTAVAIKKARKWKRCKACENSYTRQWRDLNRPVFNEYHREWRKKHGIRLKEYLVQRRKSKISKMTPDELVIFRAFESEKAKRLAAILKDQVFTAYGGWKCACCGETERAFLTIDHMLNDGYKLRKEGVHGHSTMFYRWLKKSGYPKDFQVLCMNCNFGKRMNGGVCPHQQGVTTMAKASRDECPEAPGAQVVRAVR
jgi:hypothetical protein